MSATFPQQVPEDTGSAAYGSPPPAPTTSFGAPSATGPVARWVVAGTALATTAFLTSYLYLVDPNVPTNAYPQCPMKALTGIDCPGCGGLRATNALLHGDILGALDHNILAVIIVPLMAYLMVRYVLMQFGRTLPRVPTRPFFTWAVPLFVLGFSVVRNFEGTIFYWLNSGAA